MTSCPTPCPGVVRLLLSSDFYVVYQILGRVDGVDNLWCWSHIRRYFIRAGDAHPELAGLDRRLDRADRASSTGAHRDGRRRAGQHRAHLGRRAVLRRAEHHRRRTHRPDRHTRPCCTRPQRRCWPPWTGNGTGWPATASSPNWPWTTTPPSGRCAGRWSAARTTTAPARWSPPSWPAGSSPSPPPPTRAGLNPLGYLQRLPRRMRPGRRHRPHRSGADPVPALGGEHRGPHRLGTRPETPTRHHEPDIEPIRAPGRHLNARPTATVVWTTNGTSSPPDEERSPTRR